MQSASHTPQVFSGLWAWGPRYGTGPWILRLPRDTSSENGGAWAGACTTLTFQQLFLESPHVQKPQKSRQGILDLAFSFLEAG